MKTTHFGFAQWTLRLRSVSKALTLSIMLLTPLLFLGEGAGVRCFAQANGTGAGNCLNFDGTDDYVDCGNGSSLNMNNSNLTISLFFNAATFPQGYIILLQHTDLFDYTWAKADYVLYVTHTNGVPQIAFSLYNGGWSPEIIGNTVLNTGTWYNVSVVFENSGTVAKLYLNGMLDGTGTTGKTITNNTGAVLTIGRSHHSNQSFFDGSLDEVRIWNRALTETEIRDNMCKKLTGSESGLVGYWRFDEGSGGTAYDATTNGNDGTLY